MFIPMNQDETMRIEYKEVQSQEITLLVKPVTGENEYKLYQINEDNNLDNITKANRIFDLFCIGWIDDKGNEKIVENSSKFFTMSIKMWLVNNLYTFNVLDTEVKKN